MKNKIITFLLAMGMPVSALYMQGPGCTGVCGSCGFNCNCFTLLNSCRCFL